MSTRSRRPDRPVRSRPRRVAALRVLAPTVVVAALVATPADGGGRSVADGLPSAVQREITRHDCSTTGFTDVDPASALVRTAAGRIRLVPFDEAWRLFTTHGPGSVVAVCREPARASR